MCHNDNRESALIHAGSTVNAKVKLREETPRLPGLLDPNAPVIAVRATPQNPNTMSQGRKGVN